MEVIVYNKAQSIPLLDGTQDCLKGKMSSRWLNLERGILPLSTGDRPDGELVLKLDVLTLRV